MKINCMTNLQIWQRGCDSCWGFSCFQFTLHLKCSMNGPLSKMLNVKILCGWFSRAALLNPTFICSGLIQEPPCGTRVAAGYVKAGFGPYFEKAMSCCLFAVSPKTWCFASGKWTTQYFRGCTCRQEPVLLFGVYLWQKCDSPEQKDIKGTRVASTSTRDVSDKAGCMCQCCVLQWQSWPCSSWDFSLKGKFGLSWHWESIWRRKESTQECFFAQKQVRGNAGRLSAVWKSASLTLDRWPVWALPGLPLPLKDALPWLWHLLKSEVGCLHAKWML